MAVNLGDDDNRGEDGRISGTDVRVLRLDTLLDLDEIDVRRILNYRDI